MGIVTTGMVTRTLTSVFRGMAFNTGRVLLGSRLLTGERRPGVGDLGTCALTSCPSLRAVQRPTLISEKTDAKEVLLSL